MTARDLRHSISGLPAMGSEQPRYSAFSDRNDRRALDRSENWRRNIVNWRPPATGTAPGKVRSLQTCLTCAHYVAKTGRCTAIDAGTRSGACCDLFHR